MILFVNVRVAAWHLVLAESAGVGPLSSQGWGWTGAPYGPQDPCIPLPSLSPAMPHTAWLELKRQVARRESPGRMVKFWVSG